MLELTHMHACAGMTKMLVYSIGNGPEQIAPTAYGEAFRLWKPPGLDTPPDNIFGWGPMVSVLLNKIEEVACAAFMDACLLIAQHMKSTLWNRTVRQSLEVVRKKLGWVHPVTLT